MDRQRARCQMHPITSALLGNPASCAPRHLVRHIQADVASAMDAPTSRPLLDILGSEPSYDAADACRVQPGDQLAHLLWWAIAATARGHQVHPQWGSILLGHAMPADGVMCSGFPCLWSTQRHQSLASGAAASLVVEAWGQPFWRNLMEHARPPVSSSSDPIMSVAPSTDPRDAWILQTPMHKQERDTATEQHLQDLVDRLRSMRTADRWSMFSTMLVNSGVHAHVMRSILGVGDDRDSRTWNDRPSGESPAVWDAGVCLARRLHDACSGTPLSSSIRRLDASPLAMVMLLSIAADDDYTSGSSSAREAAVCLAERFRKSVRHGTAGVSAITQVPPMYVSRTDIPGHAAAWESLFAGMAAVSQQHRDALAWMGVNMLMRGDGPMTSYAWPSVDHRREPWVKMMLAAAGTS